MAKHKRRIKLIKPRFQNQLTLVFLGLSALGLVMQFMLFQATMSELAASLPTDGGYLVNEMNGTALRVLGISLFVILPLTYVIGVLTTFRIAGPLHRIEMHMESMKKDGYTGPCRIRKGDKLQEFVDKFNEATLSLAERDPIQSQGTDGDSRDAA